MLIVQALRGAALESFWVNGERAQQGVFMLGIGKVAAVMLHAQLCIVTGNEVSGGV